MSTATTSTNGDTLTAARAYLAAGLSVVPIRDDGSKAPAVAWAEFSTGAVDKKGKRLIDKNGQPIPPRRPTDAELQQWFSNGKLWGVGVPGGKISGNAEHIDFDTDSERIFPEWCALVEAEAPGLIARLSIRQTPRTPPGYHASYRCTEVEIPGNTKFAEATDPKNHKKNLTLIETRGEGGQVLVPGCPSECHPSGGLYRHHSGPKLSQIQTITAAEREILWRCAKSFDRMPAPEPVKAQASGKRRDAGLSPGDDYCNRGPSWADLLEPAGWKCIHQRGEVCYWQRPGKDGHGWSATTGYCRSKDGRDLFAVFSSNASPFEGPAGGKTCSAYSRFAVYAMLGHGGDFSAAAKTLAQQGFGEQRGQARQAPTSEDPASYPAAGTFGNFRSEVLTGPDGKSQTARIGLPIKAIGNDLMKLSGGWPKRVGELLFVPGDEQRIDYLPGSSALFAWIGRQVGNSTSNGVHWGKGVDKVGREEFFCHVQQTTERFDAVSAFPHHPPLPRHYYHHPEVVGGNGKALRCLLERYRPATSADYDLLHAMFLTALWGGASGQRPAFLIESEDDDSQGGRGVGKSKAAYSLAHLVGGHIDARPGEDIDKLMTRLLSPGALDRRIAILDNVKALKFSWSDLEALITADVISGRQLYTGEGRRPNTLVWIITLNRASLSKDMAQRCVIIRLKRPERNPAWEAETWAYIDTHRWKIIGDIIAQLREPAPGLYRYSRWSAWERDVLSHVAEPTECQAAVEERQEAIDDDDADSAMVRQAFVQELQKRGHDPEADAVFIPSADAALIVNGATGEKRPVNRATGFLRTLTIKELRKSSWTDGSRGFCWRGNRADMSASMVMMRDENGHSR